MRSGRSAGPDLLSVPTQRLGAQQSRGIASQAGPTLTAAARLLPAAPSAPPAAFELLSRLPKHGLGSKLSRTSWTDDCFWTISKVRLSPVRTASSAVGLKAHSATQPAAAFCACPCTPHSQLTRPLRFSPLLAVQDGKHGSAWGTLTWRGQPQPPASPTALSGPLKPVWRVVADSSSSSGEQWQSMLAATLQQERQTAAAEAAEGAAAGEEAAAPAAEQAASA